MKQEYTAGFLAAAFCLCILMSPTSAYAIEGGSDGSADASVDAQALLPEASDDAQGDTLWDISQAKSLRDASVSLDAYSFEYTGKPIRPAVTVRYDGQLLVEGKDYAIADDEYIVPGTGTVALVGMGEFSGSDAQATFSIVRSEGNLIALPGSWRHDGTGWWYSFIEGGYPHGCVQVIDGVSYRFDERGYMYSGWYKLGGQWHYSYPGGAVASGWASVDGAWYYLDPQTGAMATGWVYVDGRWYHLDSSGAMQTGWINLGGTWYWLDSSGAMAQNWGFVDGRWYYFASDGAMRTGWASVDGEWYFLRDSGAMETGWLQRYDTWYYLLGSGAMVTGRYEVSGSPYYFDADGAMRVGWIVADDGWLYASASGVLSSGWLLTGSYWYWLDPENDGIMVVGLKEISGALYKFENSGEMLSRAWFDYGDGRAAHASASGAVDMYGIYDEKGNAIPESGVHYSEWVLADPYWFHFNDDGLLDTDWQLISGSWYYFYSDGTMATGWAHVGTSWYYFNPSGAMVTGWVYVDSKWYYLDPSGAMITGWNTIDSTYYQFGSDGALREPELAATTDIQRRLVSACNSVGSPGPGLCSEWVAMVFSRIGQGQKLPNNDYDADDMFYAYCDSDDLSDLRVGMIIAVPSHTHTYMGSIYGHICIYVGNNTVMDNVGRIRTMSLGEWLSYYTTTYSPKWGWYNRYALE